MDEEQQRESQTATYGVLGLTSLPNSAFSSNDIRSDYLKNDLKNGLIDALKWHNLHIIFQLACCVIKYILITSLFIPVQ